MNRKLQRLRDELRKTIAGLGREDILRRPEGKWWQIAGLQRLV